MSKKRKSAPNREVTDQMPPTKYTRTEPLQQRQQSLVSAFGHQGRGGAESKADTTRAITVSLLQYATAAVVANDDVVDTERETVMAWCAEIKLAITELPRLLVEIDFALGRAACDLMARCDVAPDENDVTLVVAWLTAARRYLSQASHPLPRMGLLANKVATHMHMHNP